MDDSGDHKRPSFDGRKIFKKAEVESFPSVSGSNKLKPCASFFSILGCGFGDNCKYLHYVPNDSKAVNQMLGRTDTPLTQNHGFPSSSGMKKSMCKYYNTPKGLKFGEKSFNAHSNQEFMRPPGPSFYDSRVISKKISVKASYAGAIIGKLGVNLKHITCISGAKIHIQDHESDPNLKNVELRGSFEQIQEATAMMNECIRRGNFKTKLCYNFPKGACSFGDQCNFAHGVEELMRPPGPLFDDSRVIYEKISVNASDVGAIIGKKGVNSKHITSLSGAKIYIWNHESDPNLKNVELEGSFEQIQEATAMVNESIRRCKAKLCYKFTKGACNFGDRCNFAHGEEELKKSGP